MRLFVAVDIPNEAKQLVKELQEQVPDSAGKFSFTNPEQCHITLKFLGEVGTPKMEAIKEKLSKIEFDKFKLSTNGLGFFPNDNYIRVFWLGFEESEHLNKLANAVKNALPGFKEDNPFHAHATIARVKFLKDKEGFKKAVEEMKPESIEFEVDSFKLMKSELTPKGPVYQVVEEYYS